MSSKSRSKSQQFAKQDGASQTHGDLGNREGANREGANREGGDRVSGNREGGNREGGDRVGGNREGGNREGGNREGGNQIYDQQQGRLNKEDRREGEKSVPKTSASIPQNLADNAKKRKAGHHEGGEGSSRQQTQGSVQQLTQQNSPAPNGLSQTPLSTSASKPSLKRVVHGSQQSLVDPSTRKDVAEVSAVSKQSKLSGADPSASVGKALNEVKTGGAICSSAAEMTMGLPYTAVDLSNFAEEGSESDTELNPKRKRSKKFDRDATPLPDAIGVDEFIQNMDVPFEDFINRLEFPSSCALMRKVRQRCLAIFEEEVSRTILDQPIEDVSSIKEEIELALEAMAEGFPEEVSAMKEAWGTYLGQVQQYEAERRRLVPSTEPSDAQLKDKAKNSDKAISNAKFTNARLSSDRAELTKEIKALLKSLEDLKAKVVEKESQVAEIDREISDSSTHMSILEEEQIAALAELDRREKDLQELANVKEALENGREELFKLKFAQ